MQRRTIVATVHIGAIGGHRKVQGLGDRAIRCQRQLGGLESELPIARVGTKRTDSGRVCTDGRNVRSSDA